jgi:rubredoxin
MEPTVILTDAVKTLPTDGRCPKCRADESRRVTLGLAGLREACGQCGYEFLEEARG